MSKEFSVRFRLCEESILDLDQYSINCAKQNPMTRLLALGSSEGILKVAKFDNEETNVYSKLVYPQEISSVDWLTNGIICMALNTQEVALYDLIKDRLDFRQLHNDDIRNIRVFSNNEIIFWSRNGMTTLVDLRAKGRQIELKSKNNVTCANMNTSNRNIIYTTTTPGTCLNIWDMRYTKRGKVVSISKQISNRHTCDLEMFDGSLYTTDNLSNVSKISANGNFKTRLLEGDLSARFGRLSVNTHLKSLFFVSGNLIYSIQNNPIKIGNSDVHLVGCTGAKDDLFVYSQKRIIKYKIKPYVTYL